MKRRTTLLGAASLVAIGWSGHQAMAADFPSMPVRIISPYPAGSVDTVIRGLAERLAVVWKQPVVVEAKPGANEILAADAVAKAVPDGHTLFIGTESTFATNPLIYKLPYDAINGLVPVSELVGMRMALVVRPGLTVDSLPSFIALMKRDGAKYSYGSGGAGSPLHLLTESLRQSAGFEMQHVPYKVLPQALQDMFGERLDVIFLSAATAFPMVASGRLKILAITGSTRVKNVPTFEESGFAAQVDSSFLGMALPRGAPPALVARIQADVAKVLRSPEFNTAVLQPQDLILVASEPAQFEARIAARSKSAGELIRKLNIKAE